MFSFFFTNFRRVRGVLDRCKSRSGVRDVECRRREELHRLLGHGDRHLAHQVAGHRPRAPERVQRDRPRRRRRRLDPNRHYLLQVRN